MKERLEVKKKNITKEVEMKGKENVNGRDFDLFQICKLMEKTIAPQSLSSISDVVLFTDKLL